MKAWILVVATVLIGTGCSAPPEDPAKEVASLEPLFALMQQHQLVAFRYQDWCKAIEYSRGAFASDMRSTCTYVLNSKPKPFDEQASKDLAAIRQAVQTTGLPVPIIVEVESVEGKLKRAVFELDRGMSRTRYVYDPFQVYVFNNSGWR